MAIRLLTAGDIRNFHMAQALGGKYLAIKDGGYVYLDDSLIADGNPLVYNSVTTTSGTEARILFTQDAITDSAWYPQQLADDGTIPESIAADIANSINNAAGLVLQIAIDRARELAAIAERDAAAAQASALARAAGIARVVNLCGGNQSEAARRLELDQSTVNKLVRKATAAMADVADALATLNTAATGTAETLNRLTTSAAPDA